MFRDFLQSVELFFYAEVKADVKGPYNLYDFTGVLITRDTKSVLYQLLDRMEKVLAEGKEGLNKEDFIKEF